MQFCAIPKIAKVHFCTNFWGAEFKHPCCHFSEQLLVGEKQCGRQDDGYVSTDFTNRCLCHTIQHTGWNSLHQL